MRPIKLLHFADAHIDMINYGQHDPETGLPVRVMDFLRSLDVIVDRAISEPVDLVIFSGDAYRNQRPHPRFQQQWQQRMMRLSQARIPTILLVGNHDTSPAVRGGHALHEFDTLNVPYIHVTHQFDLYTQAQLGIPVQVLAAGWVSESHLLTTEAKLKMSESDLRISREQRVQEILEMFIEEADPDLPLIMAAHATVVGATYGSERQVMLGRDLQLSGNIVKHPKLDYVAMGHIHKHQEVGTGYPPVVYAGSIERVDFGEVKEKKGFVLADVVKGETTWAFVELDTRQFVDIKIDLHDGERFMQDILERLPEPEKVAGSIVRLQLTYPREFEPLLDEGEIGRILRPALSVQIAKRRLDENRARLGDSLAIEEMTPEELLALYWETSGLDHETAGNMQNLAKTVFGETWL